MIRLGDAVWPWEDSIVSAFRRGRLVLPTLLLLVPLAACSSGASALPPQVNPFKIEKIAGTDLAKLLLEPKAVERLELKTVPVQAVTAGAASTAGTSIPYAALMYMPDGSTFVYTNPEPNTFIRAAVTVERFEGDSVVLSDGPPEGTQVVTAGAAELWGVEFGVGK